MADGSFPGLVSRDRNVNAQTNTIWVRLSDDTNALAIDGSGYITSNINGSVTVSATDLDIRDLSQTQDSVLIYANTAKDGSGTDYVPLVDADGKLIISNAGGTEYVEDAVAAANATAATLVVERDDVLTTITPAEGDWTKLYASSTGALWVAVDGTVAATQSGTWNIGTVATITNVVSVDDNAGSLTIDNSTLAVVGGGTEATALRVTIANDSTGLLSIDDNGGSITVDGAVTVSATALDIRTITKATDSIQISKDTNANAEANPIYVYNVANVVSGTEVQDYDTAAAVASDATSNHDYTVTGTTFFLKSIIVSGSGNVKFEIQTGPVASLATVAVGFLTGRQGDTKQLVFDPPVEVPVTSTGTVRVIRTNRQGAATDVYSTIIGSDV